MTDVEIIQEKLNRANDMIKNLKLALIIGMHASCTCLTKTPEPKFHDVLCRYRNMREVYDQTNPII